MFQRILVPLDGSARSEQALPVAAHLARQSGGSLVLLRVVASPLEFAWPSMQEAGMVTAIIEDDVVAATRYLTLLAQSLRVTGIETSVEALPGEPAQTILTIARFSQADTIVMCSHGETGMRRWLLGSVAQKVSRHSPLPVLVIHEGAALPTNLDQFQGRPLRILVPLDGSPMAEVALAPALQLCKALSGAPGGTLHLVRVLPLPPLEEEVQDTLLATTPGGAIAMRGTLAISEQEQRREFVVAARTQAVTEASEYLQTAAEQMSEDKSMPSASVQVTTAVVVHTDVAGTLLSLAEHGEKPGEVAAGTAFAGADMIAMATHGRGGLGRWMVGSVTERVLEGSSLPLLIIRPQQAGQHQEQE